MKRIYVLVLCCFLLISCSSTIRISLKEGVTIEYGEEVISSSLYDAKQSDEDISLTEVKKYDAKQLGEQQITLVFTKGEKIKEVKTSVTVKDTKAPAITLKEEVIEINVGDEYDLNSNVDSVKDPIDGDIKYSKDNVEKDGYYLIENSYSNKSVGTYEIALIAIDKNGVQSEKKFTVMVKEKVQKSVEGEISSTNEANNSPNTSNNMVGNNDSTLPNKETSPSSNNFNNNSSNSQMQQPSENEPEQVCTIHPNAYGNTGMIFKTKDEAITYAELQVNSPESPHYNDFWAWEETADSCDRIIGYSISFTKPGQDLL